MKKLVTLAIVAASLAAAPVSVSAGESPLSGVKTQKLSTKQLGAVVGQGSTSNYYAYVGNFYASAAIQYASYGQYLEAFGSGYNSTRRDYYNNAMNNAYNAYVYYYYATAYYAS